MRRANRQPGERAASAADKEHRRQPGHAHRPARVVPRRKQEHDAIGAPQGGIEPQLSVHGRRPRRTIRPAPAAQGVKHALPRSAGRAGAERQDRKGDQHGRDAQSRQQNPQKRPHRCTCHVVPPLPSP